MSRRKQVSADILTEVPTLEEGQKFARVLGPRGKNIHEVQFSDGEELLVNLPPKFRNLVWVKRGSFVIVQPTGATDRTKVQGDIAAVLFPDHIKSYKQEGIWPFDDQTTADGSQQQGDDDGSSDGEDSDDSLFVNTNRPVLEESDSESESEDEDDDDDDGDGEGEQELATGGKASS